MSTKANSVSNPAAAANDAGLYYVNDDRLGYRRRANGNGFEYLDTEAKRILGIPDELTARQIVMIGRPASRKDPRPTGPMRGRKAISELVSYDRWGGSRAK